MTGLSWYLQHNLLLRDIPPSTSSEPTRAETGSIYDQRHVNHQSLCVGCCWVCKCSVRWVVGSACFDVGHVTGTWWLWSFFFVLFTGVRTANMCPCFSTKCGLVGFWPPWCVSFPAQGVSQHSTQRLTVCRVWQVFLACLLGHFKLGDSQSNGWTPIPTHL